MAASLQAAWTSTSASKGESLLRVLLELQSHVKQRDKRVYYQLDRDAWGELKGLFKTAVDEWLPEVVRA